MADTERRDKGQRPARTALALVSITAVIASVLAFQVRARGAGPNGSDTVAACPSDMALVRKYCVDRWEASMADKTTGQPLSPYYPPHPKLLREVFQVWDVDRASFGNESARAMPVPEISEWQRTHPFDLKAVSRPGVVPQAYLSYPLAKRACENAGKRLCTRDEWVTACKGETGTKFPYGETFDRAKCNVWGYVHPGVALHQSATFGHRDPRLNLVTESGERPFLRLTAATAGCASKWGSNSLYDMVGNVDEWVDGDKPEFVGGFYARSTSNGCESRVTNHAPSYYDYSLGVRCCRDASR